MLLAPDRGKTTAGRTSISELTARHPNLPFPRSRPGAGLVHTQRVRVVRRIDQRDMRERLREIAYPSAGSWNYILQGRYADARWMFERLLDLRNDVGLLAEEY